MKEQIIALAHEVCKSNFMEYPDYDSDIKLSLADALTILVMENVPHDSDIESHELYDFIDNVLSVGELNHEIQEKLG
jgi:hypothetical protein